MSELIRFEDFFDKNIVKDVKAIDAALDKILETQRKVKEVAQNNAATNEQVRKSNKDVVDSVKQLSEQEKILIQIQKTKVQQDNLETEAGKQLIKEKVRLQQARKKATDQAKKDLEQTKKNIKSIDTLRERNKQLIKQRNQLDLSTQKGVRQAAALNAVIDKNTKIIENNVSAQEAQKMGIGRYEESIKRALGPYGIFIDRFKEAKKEAVLQTAAIKASTTATGGFSKALKILKVALIGTGIGALVVALGSVVSYFTQTQRGADKLSQVFKTLGASVDVIRDRFSAVGEALGLIFSGKFREGAKQLKESFKGIGEEIKNEASAANTLEKQYQALEDAEISFIKVRAEKERQVENLRFLAKDENKTNQERFDLLKQALLIEQQVGDEEVKLANERAKISAERLALGESSREDIRETAELEAAAINAETQNLKKRRTIQSEILGLANKLGVSKENQFKEELAAENEMLEESLDLRKSFYEDLNTLIESQQEDPDKYLDEIDARNEAELEKVKEFSDEKFNILQEQAEKEIDLQQKIEDEKLKLKQAAEEAGKQIAIDQFNSIVDNRLNAFQDEQAAKEDALKNQLDKGQISEKKYEAELKKLRLKTRQEEAKAEKKKALFDIAVNTVVAGIKSLAATPLPLGLIPFLATLAIGATQAAVVAAQPLPAFKHGGIMPYSGFARVSEEGVERVDYKGNSFLTPAKESVIALPKGAEITPHKETVKEIEKGDVKIVDNRPIHNTNITSMGYGYIVQTKNSTIKKVNKKFRT